MSGMIAPLPLSPADRSPQRVVGQQTRRLPLERRWPLSGFFLLKKEKNWITIFGGAPFHRQLLLMRMEETKLADNDSFAYEVTTCSGCLCN